MMDFAIERAVELAQACDAWEIAVNHWDRFEVEYAPPAFHLYGTCRMGVDPATSVTNEWGQTWEVPNLFIMDGSLMPTGGAINPTSTIGAVALRCADHLAEAFGELAQG
jgi:choline dehydrogenase-like flavoprotein